MATWNDVTTAAPELAKLTRELFEANKHLTIATLRRDGAPRISGIECRFIEDDLWFGSMPNAVKALDLQRDPRFALHSGTEEPENWGGEAKLAGVVEEITDLDAVRERNGEAGAGGPSHLFRLDLLEVSTVGLDDARTQLLIEVWTPERGVRTIKR